MLCQGDTRLSGHATAPAPESSDNIFDLKALPDLTRGCPIAINGCELAK
jgi:hypothetical protein